MKAILKNYRQSPRKVRLVADAISGTSVDNALTKLSFMPKRAALPIEKLIRSAKSNAVTNFGMDGDDLIVKSILVDKGVVLKRMRPRARGSAYRINKRTSIVTVLLAKKSENPSKKEKKLTKRNEEKILKDKTKEIKVVAKKKTTKTEKK